jgi:hypothetical protein
LTENQKRRSDIEAQIRRPEPDRDLITPVGNFVEKEMMRFGIR